MRYFKRQVPEFDWFEFHELTFLIDGWICYRYISFGERGRPITGLPFMPPLKFSDKTQLTEEITKDKFETMWLLYSK